jgi:hypothetical protein
MRQTRKQSNCYNAQTIHTLPKKMVSIYKESHKILLTGRLLLLKLPRPNNDDDRRCSCTTFSFCSLSFSSFANLPSSISSSFPNPSFLSTFFITLPKLPLTLRLLLYEAVSALGEPSNAENGVTDGLFLWSLFGEVEDGLVVVIETGVDGLSSCSLRSADNRLGRDFDGDIWTELEFVETGVEGSS